MSRARRQRGRTSTNRQQLRRQHQQREKSTRIRAGRCIKTQDTARDVVEREEEVLTPWRAPKRALPTSAPRPQSSRESHNTRCDGSALLWAVPCWVGGVIEGAELPVCTIAPPSNKPKRRRRFHDPNGKEEISHNITPSPTFASCSDFTCLCFL